ncbi:MAG: DNA replication/repair protein RecF [Candidatus Chisholmbacteria bacterium]|nr:DNA replication/repair protein RecF [Candidatus Chisholmbacteria bacterium]
MRLLKLRLQGFRNYKLREFEFGDKTLIVGANGTGKSNLLEGITLLSRGESFRAGKIEEMVRWGEEVGRVKGRVITEGTESTDIEVVLTRGEVGGEKMPKTKYLVNGLSRRRMDVVGKLVVVVFRPEDLWLVEGSPAERRGWLDAVLSSIDRDYLRSLLSYEKALRRRNKILDLIREGEVDRRQLAFWDQLVIRHGTVLTNKRRELVEFVNEDWEKEKNELMIEYDFSGISEARLAQYKDEEVMAGYTLVGPHKDDFQIATSDKLQATRDLAIYGSRGEQRMAVLWLKMAELEFVENRLGERPVLLLDDIFSELDEKHRRMVRELVSRQQTIITATELGMVGKIKHLNTVRL